MPELMYREYLGNNRWHYWGYLKDGFVSPMQHYNGRKLTSQQYTNLDDMDGGPIYDGDILCIGTEHAHIAGAVAYADGRFTVVTQEHQVMFLDKFLAQLCQVTGNLYEDPDQI